MYALTQNSLDQVLLREVPLGKVPCTIWVAACAIYMALVIKALRDVLRRGKLEHDACSKVLSGFSGVGRRNFRLRSCMDDDAFNTSSSVSS